MHLLPSPPPLVLLLLASTISIFASPIADPFQRDPNEQTIVELFNGYHYDGHRTMFHHKRWSDSGCQNLAAPDQKTTKSFRVTNGCCEFYFERDCLKWSYMWTAYNRKDGELEGRHRNQVTSYWCNGRTCTE
ncbi:Protein of unknown function [Pyronema omphalodes CBS 100304]|uniref:Uncharacterized protein n=1 Tax=Pyronema omphalodes (strain CBS 100304) TaxID=1076935 RepID=U4LCT9_PYROM|nr:Protein of unknown function [Pyronema omphalodes CBS 100304]